MDWIHVATTKFEFFILVFVRVLGIMSNVPFFGARQIPIQAKIGFSYFLVLILFPLIPIPQLPPQNSLEYFAMVAQEVVLGIIIGFVGNMLFTAVQVGGQIVDLQMGFGIANVINPLSNIQQSVMSQFQYLLAILLFMVMDGHHLLLLAMQESFKIVPVGHIHFTTQTFTTLNSFMSRMFVIAVELALPSMGALFLTNLALGFVSRLVPQMNVFFIGFSLTLTVGFLIVLINLGSMVNFYHGLFMESINQILATLKVLR